MVDLWDTDLHNARTLVRVANDYASLYSTQSNKSEHLKYITIIRAKVASLKKAVNNLEIMLSDMDSQPENVALKQARRRDLDEIVFSVRSLELMLKNTSTENNYSPTRYNNTVLSPTDVNNMTNSDVSYYRDTLIKMQDDELDLLDTSASAIKNISSNIRDEVGLHNRLLGDVSTSMDQADSYVNRNRDRFNEIILRSNKRQLMLIIMFLENTFKEEEIKGYLAKVKKFAISEDDKARMRSLQDSTSISSKKAIKVEEEDETLADKDELTFEEQESLLEKMDILDTKMTIYDETSGRGDSSKHRVTATDDADDNSNAQGKESDGTGDATTMRADEIQPDYKTILIERDGEIDLKRRKLPCCMMEQEIVDSIRNHDVVLVTGDTGTGKSTQIPQFLYENGFCIDNKIIGITQTRRVACMAIAKQIGMELSSRHLVGYQIRYDKSYNERSCKIKLMTDGILINELKRDILLSIDDKEGTHDYFSKYSVIIIDEAHERKINSDVLIGLLSQIVKLRRKKYRENREMLPLKLVIMSATIRKEDFLESKLFERIKHVHVPSEQVNYTVHYNKSTPSNYLAETKRKILQIHRRLPPGSVLVFLTGKQELYDLKRLLLSSRRRRSVGTDATATCAGAGTDAGTDTMGTATGADADLDPGAKATATITSTTTNNTETKTASINRNSDVEEVKDDDEIFELNEDEEYVDTDADEKLTGDSEDEERYCKIESQYELQALTDNYKKSVDCKWLGSDGGGRLNVKILHASQTNYQQMNCFMLPDDDERIVILSTNVAETAITIPNIRYCKYLNTIEELNRYVVDSGKEKRKVFNNDKEYENFEIFNISKSSANQRAGRCGRLGHGHCYRLYTNAVFENTFPEQSPVEILETNLCSMVLLLVSMGINPHSFTYLTGPPRGHIDNAIRALVVLGIIEVDQKETKRKMDDNCMFNDPFLLTPAEVTSSGNGGSTSTNADYRRSKLEVTKLGRCVSLMPLEPRYAKMIYCVLSRRVKSVNFISMAFLVVAVLSFNGPFFIHSNMSGDAVVDQLGSSDHVDGLKNISGKYSDGSRSSADKSNDGSRSSADKSNDGSRSSASKGSAGAGRSWTNDLEKYVWLLRGYSRAESKVGFCNSQNVNPRALAEVFLQANQIHQIISINFPKLSVKVDFERLEKLKRQELSVLGECVVEGLVDRVAVGVRHLGAEYAGSDEGKSVNRSYRCAKMGVVPVYLPSNYPKHECVAYNYLMGDERIKMCNVVPVNPTHLAVVNSKLVTSREIERNPEPRYENGAVWAYVRLYYQPLSYFLTTAKTKLPEEHPLVLRAFSAAFCFGQIYSKLAEFSDRLAVGKGDFFAPVGKRSVLRSFIAKLQKFGVYNRNAFESVYKRDRKFLFEEYRSLLRGDVPQLEEVYQALPVQIN
nr:DEAD-box family helicase [Theileria orientalis]